MTLVLDTHVLVWLVEGVDALASKSRSMLETAASAGPLLVSAISFWEVAMLQRAHRLSLTRPVGAWRQEILATGPLDRRQAGR